MPLLSVTIAFMSGVLIGNATRAPMVGVAGLAMIAGLIAIIWRKRPPISILALMFLWFSLGVGRCALWRSHPAEIPLPGISDEARPVSLHARIIEDPLKHQDARGQCAVSSAVAVQHIFRSNHWVAANARLQLTVFDPSIALEYGDSVLIEAQWLRAPGAANPGQYDWQKALVRSHIQGVIRVRPSDTIVRLSADEGFSLYRHAFHLRHRWERCLDAVFSREQAGLLRSFLLGERSSLEDSLEEAFIETGTMHLLVVSGFNVGLIAWLIEWMLRLMGLSWRLRPWAGAAGIGAYCLLTGMQPPVVRAGIMGWIVLGAIAGGRVVSWPNTLAAAALIMLLADPMQLFDPSFQLSFGAVASLLAFTGRWQAAVEQGLAWIPLRLVRKTIVLSLVATFGIWVGLSPLLAWYFRLVTPAALAANVLIVPLVTLLVGFGTPLLLFSGIIDPRLFYALAAPLKLLLGAITRILVFCHHIPAGHYYVAQPSLAAVIGYYLLLLISLNRKRLALSRKHVITCWLIALAAMAFCLAGKQRLASRFLRVDVVDVGHGDSLVIRTPHHHTVVVDCGTQEAGKARLLPFLRHEGITSIDALVLTHTDEDHLGGAIPLLEKMRVRRLLTNGVRGDTLSARHLQHLVLRQKITEQVLAAGKSINLESGIGLKALNPPAGLLPHVPAKSNDNSIVLQLTQGSVSFLLTGDIEEKGLPWLLKSGALARTTVLKVPHHGSRLGAAGHMFFQTIKPQLAVISVGRLHHLPAQDTINALRRVGARIDSTAESGMISLKTDGQRLFVKRFRGSKEYSIAP